MTSNFLALIVASTVAFGGLTSAQTREPVTFKDDIRQFVMKGDDTEKVDLSLTISDTAITLTAKKKNQAETAITFESISSMTYDRRSRTRKMAPTWGRAEDHFLTIQYKSAGGIGEFVEMELGKNAAPRVLATLEARSGRKIERASGS